MGEIGPKADVAATGGGGAAADGTSATRGAGAGGTTAIGGTGALAANGPTGGRVATEFTAVGPETGGANAGDVGAGGGAGGADGGTGLSPDATGDAAAATGGDVTVFSSTAGAGADMSSCPGNESTGQSSSPVAVAACAPPGCRFENAASS